MWCIGLALDAWNLSGHYHATQDAQDAGDVTQDAQDAGDVKDATQDAQDAQDSTAPYLTQDNLLLMWLICRNLCMPSYIQNRQVTNREILPMTAKLSY